MGSLSDLFFLFPIIPEASRHPAIQKGCPIGPRYSHKNLAYDRSFVSLYSYSYSQVAVLVQFSFTC